MPPRKHAGMVKPRLSGVFACRPPRGMTPLPHLFRGTTATVLSQAMTLAETAFAATTAEAASAAFFAASQRMGATYQQTRVYRRPEKPLTSETHWAAGGVVARFAPQQWAGSTAFDYVCFECNPLLDAIRHGRTRYRFSDFA